MRLESAGSSEVVNQLSVMQRDDSTVPGKRFMRARASLGSGLHHRPGPAQEALPPHSVPAPGLVPAAHRKSNSVPGLWCPGPGQQGPIPF